MGQEDGKFILSLVECFFKQRYIIKKLRSFNDCSNGRIRGWENWWQVEFALYLEEHPDVSEWVREYPYNRDQRSTNKTKLAIDFILRKKNASRSSYIGLELKQAWSFSRVIRGMFKDCGKISSIKPKEDNLRSLWNVGVYLEDIQHETKDLGNQELKKYLGEQAEKSGYELVNSCISRFKVGNTGFKVIFF